MDRRDFIRASSSAALAAGVVGAGSPPVNRVVAENAKEGSTDWQLTRVRVDASKQRSTTSAGVICC